MIVFAEEAKERLRKIEETLIPGSPIQDSIKEVLEYLKFLTESLENSMK